MDLNKGEQPREIQMVSVMRIVRKLNLKPQMVC